MKEKLKTWGEKNEWKMGKVNRMVGKMNGQITMNISVKFFFYLLSWGRHYEERVRLKEQCCGAGAELSYNFAL